MHAILWLLLLAVIAWCAYWHTHENKRLIKRWQGDLDARSAAWLSRFAWSRTFQLLAALAGSAVLIIFYDWQLSSAREELSVYSQRITELQKPVTVATQPTAKPVIAAAPAPATATRDYYPPIAAQAPGTNVPAITVDGTQPDGMEDEEDIDAELDDPAAEDVAAADVTSVYNPEEKATGEQSAIDRLKKRYEDILVTYFFLKKCGKVQDNDFLVITAALSQEMASVNAPGRMQSDILDSAKGSYNEMYAQSSCEGEGFNTLYAQYVDYVNGLSKNVKQ